jgi:hypothetical protein
VAKAKSKAKAKPKSKAREVIVVVGTRKGAFIFRSDLGRKNWKLEGPLFPGKQVHHFIADHRNPGKVMFATANDDWFGPDIQRTENGGKIWTGTKGGVRYEEGSGLDVKRLWHIRPGRASEPGVVYCGVDPGGLFKSSDGGETWRLQKSSTRDHLYAVSFIDKNTGLAGGVGSRMWPEKRDVLLVLGKTACPSFPGSGTKAALRERA